ncbi:MAG: glycosyltransferase family 2 protein, partial [Mycobacteriales bacterium]
LVVVDDASEDATGEIAARFADARRTAGFDVDVVRHDVNRGAAAALSTGLDAARGDFVAWLSADDLFVDPGKTDRQLALFTDEATAVVFDWSFRCGSDPSSAPVVTTGWSTAGSRRRQDDLGPDATLLSLLFENPINGSSVLMRKAAVESVGGFDAELRNVDADADLWMRLSACGWHIKGGDGTGIFYRVHPGQTSADAGAMNAGTALTRVRMLAALAHAGMLEGIVKNNSGVFATAFRNRLHRTAPMSAYALTTRASAARRNPWLLAMRADLTCRRMTPSSDVCAANAAAQSLLGTRSMRAAMQLWEAGR